MNDGSNATRPDAGSDEYSATLEPVPSRTHSPPVIDVEPPPALRARLAVKSAIARAVRSWRAIAAALLVSLLAGAAALDRFWVRAETRTASSGHVVAEQTVAGAAWNRLDRGDVSALAHFAADYPQSPYAQAARTTLAALEAQALLAIDAEPDIGSRIMRLDRLLSEGGGSTATHAPLGRATAIRASLASQIEALEADLQSAGHFPGLVDGVVSAETRSAARALRLRAGGADSDLIDVVLLAQARELARAEGDGAPGSQRGATETSAISDATIPESAAERVSSTTPSGANDPDHTPTQHAFKDCFLCPEMIAVPAGEAVIGDAEGVGQADERPARVVRFTRPFAISRHEVTRDEWASCASEGACMPLADTSAQISARAPVTNISYMDARGYALWLTRKTGRRYRLPSEAEWEYAARAGSRRTFGATSQPESLCRHANHADASAAFSWRNRTCADGFASTPAPVGSFEPNAFGLFDMTGNVWEWVEDCWHPTYEGAPASSAAWMDGCAGSDRIVRGGAYSVKADYIRPGYRYPFDPTARLPFFGMRIARDLP